MKLFFFFFFKPNLKPLKQRCSNILQPWAKTKCCYRLPSLSMHSHPKAS